ncbi:hypothetical protein ASPACDRAFT_73967 [Aspergillus aculeatus ATCC 16872]|uniref:Uncharacterized protein n=1 Tax=Aspergillus aculeatus (strain ATCC 16872 / CBS 172.66 / WB 5094) TaxID=690307 RepID=A0A1L9X778_ASPA1|nr:uncharacterized protein ASPACDRAFT_73967 [Aspergillus aculeatus ATCC 16872]OJK04323.1 hypothetical protein ASPACDRAFT_73967 [Aspergillus aculeatus ATCC 16872]
MLVEIVTLIVMSVALPLWQWYQPLSHASSSIPSAPSTTDSISHQQKAQLHEVAYLMSEIYQTLVEMRYLDPAGVHTGPHNLTVLEPEFEELQIDPAVQYLYSILPYVDTEAAGNRGFLHGGEFTDFRDVDQVEQGRDPFYGSPSDPYFEDEDGPYMRPWVTPLTQLGNHGSVIVYDARRHFIWIIDQEGWSTTDLALQEVEEREPMSANRNSFEHIPHRPAGDVLRDIVRWYHALDEVPNGGDGWDEWSALEEAQVRGLYQKNGWPDAFDGEAFEVDLVRAIAAFVVESFATEPLDGLRHYKDSIDDGYRFLAEAEEKLRLARTQEEEWDARWRMLLAEWQYRRGEAFLVMAEQNANRMSPGSVCLQPQGRPLWEVQFLHEEVEQKKTQLAEAEQEWSGASGNQHVLGIDVAQWNKEQHLAKQRLAIYQKALEAAHSDAERLCPGQTFQSNTGLERLRWPYDWNRDIQAEHDFTVQGLESARSLLAQIPDEVESVRFKVMDYIRNTEAWLEYSDSQANETQE